jgi:hypothetical protein
MIIHPGAHDVIVHRDAIDPLAAARTLWLETHPLPEAAATAAVNDVTVATAD